MIAGGMLLAFGVAAPAAASEHPLDVTIEVTGWPTQSITAGDEFSVTLRAEAPAADAASLEGQLVGLAYEGEMLAISELGENGTATLTVRPLATGPHEFTPFFAESEDYASVLGESATVTVAETPVSVSLEVSGTDVDPTVYGGGASAVVVAVRSACSADAEDDSQREACAAQYGYPAGTLTLTRGDEILASLAVIGSERDAAFAAPGEDLGMDVEPENADVFMVSVPDIQLGSPESLEYTLTFEPKNWFGPGVQRVDAELKAVATTVEVYVGASPDDAQHEVHGDPVTLNAEVLPGWYGAPASGAVQFFADGVAISEQLRVPGDAWVMFDWTPTAGSGTYEITAAFTPATLNHLASQSTGYPLTITTPPAPDPDESTGPDDGNEPPVTPEGSDELAATGAEPAALLGAIALITALSGAVLLMIARRRHSW